MIIKAEPGREVYEARRSAMPTQAEAAEVCGLGLSAYMARENDQGKFKVEELARLHAALGNDGRDTIAAWLQKIFRA